MTANKKILPARFSWSIWGKGKGGGTGNIKGFSLSCVCEYVVCVWIKRKGRIRGAPDAISTFGKDGSDSIWQSVKSKNLPFPSSSPTPKILKEGKKNVSYAFYDTDFRFWVLEVSEKSAGVLFFFFGTGDTEWAFSGTPWGGNCYWVTRWEFRGGKWKWVRGNTFEKVCQIGVWGGSAWNVRTALCAIFPKPKSFHRKAINLFSIHLIG